MLEKISALQTVCSFLYENEQYGDDWTFEIMQLDMIIGDYQEEIEKLEEA